MGGYVAHRCGGGIFSTVFSWQWYDQSFMRSVGPFIFLAFVGIGSVWAMSERRADEASLPSDVETGVENDQVSAGALAPVAAPLIPVVDLEEIDMTATDGPGHEAARAWLAAVPDLEMLQFRGRVRQGIRRNGELTVSRTVFTNSTMCKETLETQVWLCEDADVEAHPGGFPIIRLWVDLEHGRERVRERHRYPRTDMQRDISPPDYKPTVSFGIEELKEDPTYVHCQAGMVYESWLLPEVVIHHEVRLKAESGFVLPESKARQYSAAPDDVAVAGIIRVIDDRSNLIHLINVFQETTFGWMLETRLAITFDAEHRTEIESFRDCRYSDWFAY